MKTEDLISLLSTGVAPIEPRVSARRFTRAIVLGGAGSLVLMAMIYGVRPDIGVMFHTPIFWAKMAFPASLAVLTVFLAAREARPGMAAGKLWAAPFLPVLVVWGAAAAVLYTTPPEARMPLVMGHTWRSCPFNILLLSVPSFIAVFWAIRGLAPTHLRLAGTAGGLLAGSLATTAYCFHCPEMSVAFWAVWYLLGMLLATALGALLGPRVLRW
jgi:hypothetical protein